MHSAEMQTRHILRASFEPLKNDFVKSMLGDPKEFKRRYFFYRRAAEWPLSKDSLAF